MSFSAPVHNIETSLGDILLTTTLPVPPNPLTIPPMTCLLKNYHSEYGFGPFNKWWKSLNNEPYCEPNSFGSTTPENDTF